MPRGARLVVTGFDANGRPVVASDQRVVGPRANDVLGTWSAELWKMPAMPPSLMADGIPAPKEDFPGPGGLLYRMLSIPSEKTLKDHPDEVEKHYGRRIVPDAPDYGMHRTNTVDLIIVVSGEVWCKFESSEVLLKAGDSLVQRGGIHAWRNRSDAPCVIAAIIVGAKEAWSGAAK